MRMMVQHIGRWLRAAERDWLGDAGSLDRQIRSLEIDDPSAWCVRCGSSVARGERRAPCLHCKGMRPRHGSVVRLAELRGAWHHLLLRIKYGGDAVAAEVLGHRLAEQWSACGVANIGAEVVVVPVPASPLRAWHRGLDPVGEIASSFARTLGAPLIRPLRHAGGAPRTGQSRTERRRGRMAARAGWSGNALAGLRVVLVDDVLTTGTTIRETARILRRLGAAEVDVGVVAVTPLPGRLPNPKMST